MTENVQDKTTTSVEDKASLRRSLQAKLNASRIERMSKKSKMMEMDKIQKQVQKELGQDYDLNKVIQYMESMKGKKK